MEFVRIVMKYCLTPLLMNGRWIQFSNQHHLISWFIYISGYYPHLRWFNELRKCNWNKYLRSRRVLLHLENPSCCFCWRQLFAKSLRSLHAQRYFPWLFVDRRMAELLPTNFHYPFHLNQLSIAYYIISYCRKRIKKKQVWNLLDDFRCTIDFKLFVYNCVWDNIDHSKFNIRTSGVRNSKFSSFLHLWIHSFLLAVDYMLWTLLVNWVFFYLILRSIPSQKLKIF